MAYIRRKYLFRGRVQGVGFRYVMRCLADRFNMTGYVQNEYDGSVTCELQSRSQRDFDVLLHDLQNARYIRIEEMEVKEIRPLPEERTFVVRY